MYRPMDVWQRGIPQSIPTIGQAPNATPVFIRVITQ